LTELVILGSSGWIPRDQRMTTSLGLRTGEDLVIFDAGSGLARLSAGPFRRLLPAPEREIHIFLTHLHFDHLIGLTFLPALWTNPTVVHIPAGEGCDPCTDALDRLLGGPFFPLAFEDLLPVISRHLVEPGNWQIGGLPIAAQRQDHPGGSLAYRVGDWFALLTDRAYDPDGADFARGVSVLVHEAWTSEQDDPGGIRAKASGHSTAEQAARLARDAEVGELLLTHLPPADDAYYAQMLAGARAIFPHTRLCEDGLTRRLQTPGIHLKGG
jgi:ribonuclease Z